MSAEGAAVALPPPRLVRDATLVDALARRQSTREFSARPVDADTLSAVLWAAWGVNRPASRHRTAPSARNWQETDLYVFTPEGVFAYRPDGHALAPVARGDLRADAGLQEFVAKVPVNLVFVADYARMPDAASEDRARYAAMDAAFIAQNVYLYCAAAGLGCVVRGLVDREKLKAVLGLRATQHVVAAQSVGWPA